MMGPFVHVRTRDAFDSFLQQHALQHGHVGGRGRLHKAEAQAALDASCFEASATVRSAYDTLAAAAGSGDPEAIRQMHDLRRQLGPVCCLRNLLRLPTNNFAIFGVCGAMNAFMAWEPLISPSGTLGRDCQRCLDGTCIDWAAGIVSSQCCGSRTGA